MAVTKDSGKRQQFETGARRDVEGGKPLFSNISLYKLDDIQKRESGVSLFDTLDRTQPYEVGYNAVPNEDLEDLDAVFSEMRELVKHLDGGDYDDYETEKRFVVYRMREVIDAHGIIPPVFLSRLRGLLERGAKKYSRNNYQKGIPVDRAVSSLERHLQQAKAGDTSEDHLSAVVFNAMLWMVTEYNAYLGKVPKDLLKGRWGAVANGVKRVRLLFPFIERDYLGSWFKEFKED